MNMSIFYWNLEVRFQHHLCNVFFFYFEIIESESLGECEVFGFEMNMSIISWKQGFNAEPQSFSKLPIVPGRILAFPLITNKFKRQSSVAGKLQRIFFWIQNCENYWHFFWAFSWMSCFRFIFWIMQFSFVDINIPANLWHAMVMISSLLIGP